jgi:undecaprenyl-diphosphatase
MSIVIWLWLVVTISSVAGSLVGYWLGKKWGRTLLDKYSSDSAVLKLEALTQRYGTFGIFIAAFSPIPYKVFGWVAGMGEMEKRPFIIAGLLGRGLRFGVEALLIGIYGNKVLDGLAWFVDHEFLMGASLLVIIAIGIVSWSWWQGLAPVAEEE